MSQCLFLLGKLQSALNSIFLFLGRDAPGAQVSLDWAALGFSFHGYRARVDMLRDWGAGVSACLDRCHPHSLWEALSLRPLRIPSLLDSPCPVLWAWGGVCGFAALLVIKKPA